MSTRPRTVLLAFCAFLSSVALPQPVATQATTTAQSHTATSATLAGVVTDNGGGVVPGATVTVVSVATGEKLPPQVTNAAGAYSFPGLAPGRYQVTITLQGFKTVRIDVTLAPGSTASLTTKLEVGAVSEVVAVKAGTDLVRTETPTVTQSVSGNFVQTLPRSDRAAAVPASPVAAGGRGGAGGGGARASQYGQTWPAAPQYGETYSQFEPNRFQSTVDQPLSTFGADVDTASYANVRRFLSSGQLPPGDAIRIEELVNYFRFGYAGPRDGRPIALTTEIGECPWAPSHKLVLIGARAVTPAAREITGRNIVLLLDVSGSMAGPERLPLIKTALGLFVDTLKPHDTLAIVTYAGTSGVALPPTPARQRDRIQDVIGSLSAGGSTNGGQGLILAYQIARQAFISGGVNRVILATDGDFNVGIVDQRELLRLIERERDSGVFLSVFGVGTGNLKDATMEMLADRGNGHYAYLDSLQEARRVLIREGDATLDTVAKDVKFQVEFNPAVVSAWKLLGYENRALRPQDFNNDRKDAGEMGAGHTVTVLYEVVPAGAGGDRGDRAVRPDVDPLRYQSSTPATPARPVRRTTPEALNGEWLTVKARYKLPDAGQSELISKAVRPGTVQHLPLASAIAEFGLILRDDPRNIARWNALQRRLDALSVPSGLVTDVDGLRELTATAAGLARIR